MWQPGKKGNCIHGFGGGNMKERLRYWWRDIIKMYLKMGWCRLGSY